MAQIYGPVMSFRFGQKPAVIASSPAAAEQFLKIQGHNFAQDTDSEESLQWQSMWSAGLGLGLLIPSLLVCSMLAVTFGRLIGYSNDL